MPDQDEWVRKFQEELRNYVGTDLVIARILKDARMAAVCGTKLRSHVDRSFTQWWNSERKQELWPHLKKLKAAIAGLRVAFKLYSRVGTRITGGAALRI